jgi:hypothetical protein
LEMTATNPVTCCSGRSSSATAGLRCPARRADLVRWRCSRWRNLSSPDGYELSRPPLPHHNAPVALDQLDSPLEGARRSPTRLGRCRSASPVGAGHPADGCAFRLRIVRPSDGQARARRAACDAAVDVRRRQAVHRVRQRGEDVGRRGGRPEAAVIVSPPAYRRSYTSRSSSYHVLEHVLDLLDRLGYGAFGRPRPPCGGVPPVRQCRLIRGANCALRQGWDRDVANW